MKNENTILTTKEEKIAKRCTAKYRGFFVRHATVIGWLGAVLFVLGLPPNKSINENIKIWIFTVAIIMIFFSAYSELTIIIGKLYEQHQGCIKSKTNEKQDV